MEETQNKRNLRRSKKLLDAAARDALVEKPRPLHKGLEQAIRRASEAVPLCIGGRAALEGKRIRRALDQARLTPADALTLDQQHLIDDGTGEYSFRLCSPSCSLGAILHTVYLMSVNGQGSDESHGRWQDYTHTQHRQRG